MTELTHDSVQVEFVLLERRSVDRRKICLFLTAARQQRLD
jgi:hypothetical protein